MVINTQLKEGIKILPKEQYRLYMVISYMQISLLFSKTKLTFKQMSQKFVQYFFYFAPQKLGERIYFWQFSP